MNCITDGNMFLEVAPYLQNLKQFHLFGAPLVADGPIKAIVQNTALESLGLELSFTNTSVGAFLYTYDAGLTICKT